MNTRIKIKKGLIPKAIKWYCGFCDGFTKTVTLKQGVMKCLCCGRRTLVNYYDCPQCGAESDSWYMGCTNSSECDKDCDCDRCEHFNIISDTLVELGPSRYNYAASMEYGSCYDWSETHKCWHCGTIYEFENSNC